MDERRRVEDTKWDTVIAHMAATNEKMAATNVRLDNLTKVLVDHNGRLRTVENEQSYAKGAVWASGVLGGLVVAIVTGIITWVRGK